MIRSCKLFIIGGVGVFVFAVVLLGILDKRRLNSSSRNVQLKSQTQTVDTPAPNSDSESRELRIRQEVTAEELARQKIIEREHERQELERRELAEQAIERRRNDRQKVLEQQLEQQEMERVAAERLLATRERAEQSIKRSSSARQDFEQQSVDPLSADRKFIPIRSLYTLRSRTCEDDDLSSLILQTELTKKDRRLAWQQHDIDDCNAMVLSYVERAVRENKSYFLRRKLVESFGQTNHTTLINRLRLVAVLLGGERGQGGMDPRFRSIREEAHRISPYVLVLVEDYIADLEQKMTRARTDRKVDKKFVDFVDSLGDSFQSEYGVADVGARTSDHPARELYALKVLLRDLRTYYGERVEGQSDAQRYQVIFADPGSFNRESLLSLKRKHHSMPPNQLAEEFIELGLELREYLSELRDKASRHDDEEINHLKKLNEISATVTGLFGASRRDKDPKAQAKTLVDLLFLEGLYSKKKRKSLLKELNTERDISGKNDQDIRAFHTFLNYMHGLAYASLDEGLGNASRAYSKFTREAENYMEVQARKSALQVLGQLQQEFYQKHRKILAGKKDIHLAGTARGRLKIFRSESAITTFLRQDPLNGADTIWVVKSGLNMPNEGSFAAIILEDPIMKASHYDGYARSKRPPIPLLQIPEATKSYAKFDGKHVLMKASKSPAANVDIVEVAPVKAPQPLAVKKVRLPQVKGNPQLIEIDSAKSDSEIRKMQKHAGSKAANYAFLRTALPLDKSTHEEHIYPGFAIPFYFYSQHLNKSGADQIVRDLNSTNDPETVNAYLAEIRNLILIAPIENDSAVLDLIQNQLDHRLRKKLSDQSEIIKLRFRSSSNAEDNKDFSGAGLYESHFAYYSFENDRSTMRDTQSKNRAYVANAMKKVWASLWKAEAYQAREQAGIVQETVRMGILVHPSYRKEESTGVIFYYSANDIEIAVNKGNVNVQNPSIAGLTPEMHRVTSEGHHIDYSSRFALSENVILSSKDQKQLMELLDVVVPKFRQLYPSQGISGVDIEFKVLEVPDRNGDETDVAMFKQIRPLAKRVNADPDQ